VTSAASVVPTRLPAATAEALRRPRANRELYIDVFRGLMALVMVQGHLFDTLLNPAARAQSWYVFQQIFHGSTAPGFLFASGFVAGLPRAPLSWKAMRRRARRLLFVLGVGYALRLPYLSVWKIHIEGTPLERATAVACDALHAIAVSQLFVLLLQRLFGRRWVWAAGLSALAVIVASPWAWDPAVAAALPLPAAAYVSPLRAPSQFPLFPYAAFVLAGTLAGAQLGRQDVAVRRRRALVWGTGLMALGALLAVPLAGRVDFWGPSPAYVLLRLGGLLLLLRLVGGVAERVPEAVRPLALLGHETLLVYVLHLLLLFGGVLGRPPLEPLVGHLGFGGAALVLVLMLPVLLLAAACWRAFKTRAPHEATMVLAFLATVLVFELLTRPW
jgi:fucose 4-O-acetylase-like acetyltransferase